MVLKSDQYDDVYFSAQDGLAESRYVFLDGNDLAARFAALRSGQVFTIAESGFGTGLNFLAAWDVFVKEAPPEARLHFISVEKFPLTAPVIAQALQGWKADLAGVMAPYLAAYPADLSQDLQLSFEAGRVQCSVMIGDINDRFPKADFKADAWFLDGFKPSSNPDMWGEALFCNMARLSAAGASFASFTAAGFVRRGLQAGGFDVVKRAGFGRKREMTVGRLRLTVEAGA